MRESRPGTTALDVLTAPVTVLVGNFGTGKSEIAVNLALAMRARGDEVTLVDLDLVKPYFRSRLMKADLEQLGIAVITPQGDRYFADLPILVPEVRGAVARSHAGGGRTILDVGGDDVGARVLGSLPGLGEASRTDVVFVVNGNRPFAETCPAVVTMIREIEAAAHIGITGLIANTHLIDETTPETVAAGLALADEVSAATGLPILFGVALGRILPALAATSTDHHELPWLAIERFITVPLELRAPANRRRFPI